MKTPQVFACRGEGKTHWPVGAGQKCWISHFVLNLSILGKRSLSGEKVRSDDASSDVSWVRSLLVSGFLKYQCAQESSGDLIKNADFY